jgi:hypothetical protein
MVDWMDTGGEIPEETPGGAPKWLIAVVIAAIVVIAIVVVFK